MVDLKLLVQTSDYLIVNKPAGWVVNEAESVKGPTIQEWLRTSKQINKLTNYQLRNNTPLRQGIVHRLDKDTSGVLVVAKTQNMLSELQRQFKQRLTKKTYEALVHGKLEPQEGAVSLPVGRSKFDRHKFTVSLSGKVAETAWKVRKYVQKNDEWLTEVELFPKTGRTHQLRVHMSHLKHPIVGDPIYLTDRKLKDDLRWCGGLRLVAKKLCFEYKGSRVCYEV